MILMLLLRGKGGRVGDLVVSGVVMVVRRCVMAVVVVVVVVYVGNSCS